MPHSFAQEDVNALGMRENETRSSLVAPKASENEISSIEKVESHFSQRLRFENPDKGEQRLFVTSDPTFLGFFLRVDGDAGLDEEGGD